MKIIHLSDPHITPPGTLLKGIDPGDNLRAAIAQINTRHQDADWVMITGDLTRSGAAILRKIHLPKSKSDFKSIFCSGFGFISPV